MPTTKLKHLISVTVLVEAIQAEFEGMTSLWGTNAVIVKTDMPTMTLDGGTVVEGDKIRIPYFDSMGELEDIVNEGDALTPSLLTASDEEAIVQHSGKAFELTRFARRFGGGGKDPYAEAARQFRTMVERRADKALLDSATAGLNSNFVNNVYDAGTPVNLDWDVVVDSKLLWGDEQEDIALIVMHSKVYGSLIKLKDANGRPLLLDPKEGKLGTFAGIPIKVSDRGTVDSTNPAAPIYKTKIFKKGSLIFWMGGTPDMGEDRDILANTDILAYHVYWAAHRYRRTPGGTKPGVVEIRHNVA